ncbi:5'-nucleotidase C-terminal domain-containing protein [Plectonema cf. radiosum LEGE 06105]|uniref:5'-nucleotidase C-terminal domain-containing protein n=1 Tax=Plectonema cf. radiosum LEGE 06105 TaxID=945769 RepID=A0A8J7JWJ7_9CYAN|nr:5'-nucleotidase C-terminal domain-containing protein [Plectonema radiosum]MBE9215710.1 5'-nucleotidase C-terminal domain-containing protein [Plectonema cf. radiosum LEGE 06105]
MRYLWLWFLALILLLGSLFFSIVSPAFIQQPNYTLHILHTNDHHAHLEPIQIANYELGGITKRKTLIDKIRSQNAAKKEPLLLLDAGDIFQGTLYFNRYLGQADLYFYNALGYDAATLGNHDFDRGQQVLADFINKAQFPLISANIEVDKASPLADKIKPWTIFQINGEKIGVFGLTTEETAILSNPGDGLTFTDPILAAKNAVTALTAQNVNKIIALTHIGINADQELARRVNGIDVIVGGHSHTPLGKMPGATEPYPIIEKSPDGHKVLIVTDWEWGKYLGDIRVGFDTKGDVISWKSSPKPVSKDISPDLAFEEKLEQFAAPIEALREKIVGETTVALDANRTTIRTQETNLGDLISDAMLDKTRPDGAQVVIINSGNIRTSIPTGHVTVGQLLEVLPFGNTITRLDLTGTQLKQALENGVSKIEDGEGRFPQVAGLRFEWNPIATVGNRILSIQIQNSDGNYKPLEADSIYRVITNNFLLSGGDGYKVFKNGKNQVDTGFLLVDVVTDYITSHLPVTQQVDKRIVHKAITTYL